MTFILFSFLEIVKSFIHKWFQKTWIRVFSYYISISIIYLSNKWLQVMHNNVTVFLESVTAESCFRGK